MWNIAKCHVNYLYLLSCKNWQTVLSVFMIIWLSQPLYFHLIMVHIISLKLSPYNQHPDYSKYQQMKLPMTCSWVSRQHITSHRSNKPRIQISFTMKTQNLFSNEKVKFKLILVANYTKQYGQDFQSLMNDDVDSSREMWGKQRPPMRFPVYNIVQIHH